MQHVQGVDTNSVPEIPVWGLTQSQTHQTHAKGDKHFVPKELPTEKTETEKIHVLKSVKTLNISKV